MRLHRMTSFALTCAAALGLLAASGTQARAGFVPTFISSSGNTYNYTLNFTSNGATETLASGNNVTLYDVAGVTLASQVTVTPGANILVTTPLTGVLPPAAGGPVNPTDSNLINNIVFTYTGTPTTTDTVFNVVVTTTGVGNTGQRTGQYTSFDNIALGSNNQIGAVIVPSSAIPEPTSVVMLGLGIGAIVGIGRFRNRKTTV